MESNLKKKLTDLSRTRKDLQIDKMFVEMCRLHNSVWPMMKPHITAKEHDDSFMRDFDYIKTIALENLKRK